MPLPFEQRRRQTTAKLAALMLANAFIFQEQLSALEERVEPIRAVLARRDFIGETIKHWSMIIDEINYVPIFRVARDILSTLPAGDTDSAVRKLAERSLDIVSKKAALRHDLMGRIYHLLLLEAKYLGTYYTSVPAATLLVKLALDVDRWPDADWAKTDALKAFKIADLACGTGTLLMAASQAVTDNFIKFKIANDERVDDDDLRRLHKFIVEEMLHGYDVLPSAVHLTASTLALLAPDTSFRNMSLYSLSMGRESGQIYLGSIDYISASRVRAQLDLMSPQSRIAGAEKVGEEAQRSVAPLPELDFCVMNPPFVRSVGGNLLFGSIPDHRGEMQTELARRIQTSNLSASSTAGLGSVFAAVGDRHIKPGGRLALVLPAAITTGVAWDRTRDLIKHGYALETVIVSHDPARWSFSENTELSEVLLIARKRAPTESAESLAAQPTQFISLWRNPTTSAHALALSERISKEGAAPLGTVKKPVHGVRELAIGTEKFGETVELPWGEVRDQPWVGACFAQTSLIRATWFLRFGKLYTPGRGQFAAIPICRLGDLAALGPDRRDVYDGYRMARRASSYPALWGHAAEEMKTIGAKPNAWLVPRSEPLKGRPLRDAALLWGRAGRLMIAERMWLVTQKLVCVRLPDDALSNVWWPLRMRGQGAAAEKALALWLNSTLGLLSMIGHRVPTRGPWVQFKKPVLEAMPVLDVRALSKTQLTQLASAYDAVASSKLGVLREMENDEVRASMDAALSRVLDLPTIGPIRALLGREPVISDASLAVDMPEKAEESVQFELL